MYPHDLIMHSMSSTEGKPIVQDKLSEVAASLISAYESGELLEALSQGHSGWQKWVKSFGKSLKRKVGSVFGSICFPYLCFDNLAFLDLSCFTFLPGKRSIYAASGFVDG